MVLQTHRGNESHVQPKINSICKIQKKSKLDQLEYIKNKHQCTPINWIWVITQEKGNREDKEDVNVTGEC